jgi:uncharacterized cofD-like protein
MFAQTAGRAPRLVAESSSTPHRRLRFVALGGGTGLPAVLRTVRLIVGPDAPPSAITAIVTVTDDGGSSGQLRREHGVLPPGDVRNCVAALAGDTSAVASLLQYRFENGHHLEGHPVGNLILTALTKHLGGDFPLAVDVLSRMAGVGGRVLPATADDVHLRAEYVSGEVTVGETAIASRRLPIRRLSLEHPVRPLPEVIEALVNADVIIVGPGSLYTSILPVLLVDGVAATISGLCATRIFVSNLMTEPGETDGFRLDDHLRVIRDHTGYDLFDFVLVNQQPLGADAVAHYAERGSVPVPTPNCVLHAGQAEIVGCDLAAERDGQKIRHEPVSLADAIRTLLRWGRPAGAHATRIA